MEINRKITELLGALEDKYRLEGQEMEGYLEGLLYNSYLDYWDYINQEALLNLQHRRTDIPDEMIFIIYHQITELYFKLTLWEIEQVVSNKTLNTEFFSEKLRRMISYFTNLTHSFEIMVDGMDPKQFLKFRLSLLPASGFQSVQYRLIEIASTPLINLVDKEVRDTLKLRGAKVEELYKYVYWKKGATDLTTGHKTLTLRRFEKKYKEKLTDWALKHADNNLYTIYLDMPKHESSNSELIKYMRAFDHLVNVDWPMVHLKSAGRYLAREEKTIGATGGTNWQKYLPPRIQRRVFFPTLWTEEELENWGKLSYAKDDDTREEPLKKTS